MAALVLVGKLVVGRMVDVVVHEGDQVFGKPTVAGAPCHLICRRLPGQNNHQPLEKAIFP